MTLAEIITAFGDVLAELNVAGYVAGAFMFGLTIYAIARLYKKFRG